ncbi:PaaI family thioesterase [candidate division FCPU426 bacterium]|nr:PaaI family thioesterase [candidate division FCPU426 bacterium]
MPTEWRDNQMCFACGGKNPQGLHLTFAMAGEDGLQSEFTPTSIYQGFADIVHGGFIGLLLDEVIANLYYFRKREVVVTAELTLRLHRPAKVGEKLIVSAFPDGTPRGRLVPIRGEVRLEEGTLIASAKAKCMKVRTLPHAGDGG